MSIFFFTIAHIDSPGGSVTMEHIGDAGFMKF